VIYEVGKMKSKTISNNCCSVWLVNQDFLVTNHELSRTV